MTEARARMAVIAVGILIVAAIARLVLGSGAVDVVLLAAVAWLVWDRTNVHDKADEARDGTDLALGKVEAVENHLTGLEPPGAGRHAHQGRSRT